jgi:hypothetical protein
MLRPHQTETGPASSSLTTISRRTMPRTSSRQSKIATMVDMSSSLQSRPTQSALLSILPVSHRSISTSKAPCPSLLTTSRTGKPTPRPPIPECNLLLHSRRQRYQRVWLRGHTRQRPSVVGRVRQQQETQAARSGRRGWAGRRQRERH